MSAHADKNQTFSIRNTTKGRLPSLPFVRIKESVLGKSYTLSCVFVGDALSRKLNRTYRRKNKPANVLSFSLSKTEGEIFINLKRAEIEAPQFEENYKNFVGYLFIHGLLHLKGLDHGSRMERAEKKFRKCFGV